MNKKVFFILMAMMIGLPGCSVRQIDRMNPSGVGVMFDGEPLIFDSSVVFLGTVVGGVVISLYLPLFSLIGKLAG